MCATFVMASVSGQATAQDKKTKTPARKVVKKTTILQVRLNLAPKRYRYVSVDTANLTKQLSASGVVTMAQLKAKPVDALAKQLGALSVRQMTIVKVRAKRPTQRLKAPQLLESVDKQASLRLAQKLKYAASMDKRAEGAFDSAFYALIPQSKLKTIKR